jgi:glycosyltransferase involved in cell wall biosynthesis
MMFLVYSEVNAETIANSLGLSEYSYYFVLKEFLPVLRELGEVQVVKDPLREVDRLYTQARRRGERCVFLSFTPPHKTPLGLRCPTVPVMAWEFDTIPSEHWFGERAQDWRYGLRRCGRSITHSGMTVAAIQAEMGVDYPVVSIPAPVWDKYAPLRERLASQFRRERLTLKVRGVLLDSHDPSFLQSLPSREDVVAAVAAARNPRGANCQAATLPAVREESLLRISYRYAVEWYRLVGRELFADWQMQAKHRLLARPLPVTVTPGLPSPQPLRQSAEHTLELSGVVFTALFNPGDGRKNWVDMLTAFCAAFRDCGDATLVFKLGSTDYDAAINDMLICMARLPKFACRVVLLSGFLEGEDFEALIEASHYVVNASYGEGQCLPLMEFLSCGRPAVAPRNSAMLDYIDVEVGFVVDGWQEARAWPQDPRAAFRTCQQQIDWESLVTAYRAAYDCFTQTPERYLQLSQNAVQRMQSHCSHRVAKERLKQFLHLDEAHSQ